MAFYQNYAYITQQTQQYPADYDTGFHSTPVRGTRSDTDIYSREPLGKMDTYKPTEPRWEARLTP